MTSAPFRPRLSLLAVASLTAVGSGVIAASAHASGGGVPPSAAETLTAPGATAMANGDLITTAPALPYTVAIHYTAQAVAPNSTVSSVAVSCDQTAGAPQAKVVTPFDGTSGVDTCTYTQLGSYEISTTALDSFGTTGSVQNSVVLQPAPPPPPSKAPAAQLSISSPQGTTDAAGNLSATLPTVGNVTTSALYRATPAKVGQPNDIASATLDCGIPNDKPVQLVTGSPAAQQGMGIAAGWPCYYSQAGTYTITFTATDTETPAQSTTLTRTVTVAPAVPVSVDRYDGASRYGTGVALSQAEFPVAGSAGAVVLARGDVFADALSGIPLAAAKNAPLLLTPGGPSVTGLDKNVENELTRVLPKDRSHTVYLLGGTGALPKQVEDHIAGLGYTVVRLAGASRFDTALAIAQDPRALNNPANVVVARGDDFADALAAGPFAANADKDAAGKPAAIVLSDGPASSGKLDAATSAYVSAKLAATTSTVTAIGGGAQAAVAPLPGAAAKVKPIVGSDRYVTAYDVARQGWSTQTHPLPPVFHAATMGIATGERFPDALTGGAYMALKNGPLLLTEPGALSGAAANPMSQDLNTLTDVAMFGGPGVLSQDMVDSVLRTVNSPARAYHNHYDAF